LCIDTVPVTQVLIKLLIFLNFSYARQKNLSRKAFQLSDRVPEDNFYRHLKGAIDIDFCYKLTAYYYDSSGQKSID